MSRLRRSVLICLMATALMAVAQVAIAGDEPFHASAPSFGLRGEASRGLRAAAVAHAMRAASSAQEAAQPEATEPDEPRQFFKSPRGIVVLAAVVATAGYVFYSKSRDRVHSPGME